MTPIPLSLYIHVPWCERKCPYCDFNSHQARGNVDEDQYVDALLADLDADLAHFGQAATNRPIHSVFIGGGTPSLFSPTSYQRLFDGLRQRCEFEANAEVTLEANPGSSEASKFAGFREAGINRLSIGIQSFNPAHLTVLGRVHNSQEALNAGRFARAAGFDNFNLDLMFGLPDQSNEQALADLTQAIELNPTHLSCYQLTIEPNTLFHHAPPVTPDDDALWQMQQHLQSLLAQHSYQQYEVSAYAKTGRRCQHNLNYWQYGDYLGIGAGAHSKVTDGDALTRSWKIKHPTSYLSKASKVGARELIEPAQRPIEFMMNALRLTEGFRGIDFEARTHVSLTEIQTLLDKHQSQGLITRPDGHIVPTAFGHNMLNSMLEDYLS
ncbi:radical SAM family heme chaperone HemW [Arenicella xantha]|uniref:Heme chaperone HemW n=1 Tax=Arenicella xantha TaxID=644221 RepID=A0A395JSG3_9GAMM|nr:radical SAM family heme chaperone HemW [Arenicella xantha]RBP53475.1 anaerobic coproporphyrinogen III oxidase [Arenicella xantha]